MFSGVTSYRIIDTYTNYTNILIKLILEVHKRDCYLLYVLFIVTLMLVILFLNVDF